MPEPQAQPTFELGLVMAGAISGGAYAAGVLDFLIQALDAWEDAKAQSAEAPRHRVLIPVISGASAGAMAAAIATVSLGSETRPAADPAAPPAPDLNRLYDAWVRQIDIRQLLERRDLDGADKVTSLLDSTALKEIAEGALRMQPRATPRAYVADPLAVLLTISNLRGVPYGSACSAAVPTRSTACPATPTTWRSPSAPAAARSRMRSRWPLPTRRLATGRGWRSRRSPAALFRSGCSRACSIARMPTTGAVSTARPSSAMTPIPIACSRSKAG